MIYGVDSYRFKSEPNSSYLLTIEKHLDRDLFEVALMELNCNDKTLYNLEIRSVVSKILYDFMVKNSTELCFDFIVGDKKGALRLMKFYRWSECYPDVLFDLEITEMMGDVYAEITVSIKP